MAIEHWLLDTTVLVEAFRGNSAAQAWIDSLSVDQRYISVVTKVTAKMWNELSLAWRASLEEAWAAYCAGCVPIGAVITDAAGIIIARGRNHIRDDVDAPVKRHELAHAELNALLCLHYTDGDGHDTDPRSWTLYTTMEPCPLCMGAFYMSGLRQLHYAARDPWAGSVNLLGTTPYLSRKPIRVSGPLSALEILSVAMNVG